MNPTTQIATLATPPRAPVTGLPTDLRRLALDIHCDNIRAGWWQVVGEHDEHGDLTNVTTVPRNVGELLALVHSEISEADDGFIGELMDDKLPHREMVEVELADTAIRVLDLLGYYRDPCDRPGAQPPYPFDEFIETASWGDWCRLMHRTTTRALEGFRKGREREGREALVDLLGHIHFTALSYNLDLTGAIVEKRAYNAVRLDHKLETRAAAGGKAF